MKAIEQTKRWIKGFVIELDLCPFASSVFLNDAILYSVEESPDHKDQMIAFVNCLHLLKHSLDKQTGFILLPNASKDFGEFLELFYKCEIFLEESSFKSDFQLAGFHPEYVFGDSDVDDPANYTNRSPYPMIHILSIEDVHRASVSHDNIAEVPAINIRFLRNKGVHSILITLRNLFPSA